MNEQRDSIKKPSRLRYVIAACIFAILIAACMVYILSIDQDKSDPASERVLRNTAAIDYKIQTGQDKEPNELTDEDFAVLEEFHLPSLFASPAIYEISDIKLLEKFTNLRNISLSNIHYPKRTIPTWLKVLEKLGIKNYKDRNSIDLKPLSELFKLNSLQIQHVPVNNIEPLSKLSNLQILYLSYTQVSDIEPLRKLSNLEKLYLEDTLITDLDPLKELTNLKALFIGGCENIKNKDKQIEDLLKALPELKIYKNIPK